MDGWMDVNKDTDDGSYSSMLPLESTFSSGSSSQSNNSQIMITPEITHYNTASHWATFRNVDIMAHSRTGWAHQMLTMKNYHAANYSLALYSQTNLIEKVK